MNPFYARTSNFPESLPVKSRKPDLKRVLVVDDCEDIRLLLKSALTMVGLEVNQASNGLQAWEMMGISDFDLVITDLNMPVMDGYALIDNLSRMSPRIPIVVISGKAAPSDDTMPITGDEAGIFAFLEKPFGLKELQQVALAAMNQC